MRSAAVKTRPVRDGLRIAALALLTSSCALGPNFERPVAPDPPVTTRQLGDAVLRGITAP